MPESPPESLQVANRLNGLRANDGAAPTAHFQLILSPTPGVLGHIMGKLSRSWDLVGKSFGILLSDKELLYLPIASGIACLCVSVIILAAYALIFPSQITAFAATSGTRHLPITQGMWA